MQLFKLGAVLAFAQAISAAQITLKNTTPPANPDEIRCTLIIHDPISGCKGSSEPWEENCGRNEGTASTRDISDCSNGGQVTVNWHTGKVTFSNDSGAKESCILSDTKTGGHCNTDQPHQFEKGDYSAANSLVSSSNALYALAPMAAGLFI